MGFGALTLGLVVLVLLALRIAEVRTRNRNPRRVSMVRPVGEPTWNVPLDELVTAARDAGLSVDRRPDGFSIRGDRIGRRLDVERANPDEYGWVIWSNETHVTAAVLRAFETRFGPLALSIPLEHDLVVLEIYPIHHERMTIIIEHELAVDTLAAQLGSAHEALVVEIERCIKIRLEILELLLARKQERAPA